MKKTSVFGLILTAVGFLLLLVVGYSYLNPEQAIVSLGDDTITGVIACIIVLVVGLVLFIASYASENGGGKAVIILLVVAVISIVIAIFMRDHYGWTTDGDRKYRITEINLDSTSQEKIELAVGESVYLSFSYNGDGEILESDFEWIGISHESNTISITDQYTAASSVFYEITANSRGLASFYIASKNGAVKSDIVYVTVGDGNAEDTTDTETQSPNTNQTETTTPETEKQPTETNKPIERTYTLNTNTKKFHYPSCSSAKKISDANKSTFEGTREELIAMGYESCGQCHP